LVVGLIRDLLIELSEVFFSFRFFNMFYDILYNYITRFVEVKLYDREKKYYSIFFYTNDVRWCKAYFIWPRRSYSILI